MVEMDVPLDTWRNYDIDKGIKWGDAIKKSNEAKGGGSHGLPGGFGIGGAPAGLGRGRGRGEADPEVTKQRIIDDYAGAVQRKQVLTEQTLGGQSVLAEETTPNYFIGSFRSDQLHLTPVDHIVQMRPQFHHIDAQTEQERINRPRDPGAVTRVAEARAIHMTVKSTVDGEEDRSDNMGLRIAAAQQEAWRRHRYVDEDSGEAWTAFHEHLFVGPAEKEQEELMDKMPKLTSGLDDMDYMDSISAPNDAAKLSRSKRAKKSKKGKEVARAGGEEGENDSTGTLSDPEDPVEDLEAS